MLELQGDYYLWAFPLAVYKSLYYSISSPTLGFFLADMYKMVSAPGTSASFVLLWTSSYSSFCLECSPFYPRNPMICSFTSFRSLLNCQVLYEAFPVHPLKNLICLSPTPYPPSLLNFSP